MEKGKVEEDYVIKNRWGNKMSYLKGSEWRKWDLHVHTPFSYLNTQFGNDFDEYVRQLFKKAIEKNIAAIGITDYFTIEGYKKLKQDYLENEEKLKELFTEDEIEKIKQILILPNIEFRLNKLVGSKRINYHVIFSNELPIEDIEDNFLREIKFIYEGAPQTEDEKRPLTKHNLEMLGQKLREEHEQFQSKSDVEIGMTNAVVDDTDIARILANKKSIFDGKYLLLVPSDGDLSRVSWDSQDHNVRKVIIQKADGLFASNPNTIKWGLGKDYSTPEEFIKEFKSLKPCIWGSDAHDFDKLFEPDERRYTWIKADPTFEGLRQITYEPEERVRIQEQNPEFEVDKPYFSSIVISGDISVFEGERVTLKKQIIPLNKNLVTIIGGRGTGKSLLVNYLAHMIGYKFKEKNFNFVDDVNFKVEYAKNNNETPEVVTFSPEKQAELDAIFIEQNKLKKLTDEKQVADEIKKLLSLEKLQFNNKLDEEITVLLREIEEIKGWFKKENEQGEKINDREFNENKLEKYEKLLSTITTEKNKEKLQKYTENIKQIRHYEDIIEELNALRLKLEGVKTELNFSVENINKLLPNDLQIKLTPVAFATQLNEIDNIKDFIENYRKIKEQENKKIKSDFEQEGFRGDLTTLLQNAEKYQREIEEINKRLKLIGRKEKLLKEKLDLRKELGKKLREEYERQKQIIEEAWHSIFSRIENPEHKNVVEKILSNRGIEITGQIKFDLHKFNEKLKTYLDLRTFRGDNPSEDLGISDIDSYWRFIEEDLGKYIEGEKSSHIKRDKNLGELFFNLKERREYLHTIPEITYNGKTLDKLSAGQKGTLYLLLQLATKTFSTPLIIDQPEDDLDNEFITKELVNLFKELKKYRQMIIVTHNANLVVTADAEQVIVANNEDENISYIMGSLENPVIIEKVCQILEGGKEAFEKRKNKYNF